MDEQQFVEKWKENDTKSQLHTVKVRGNTFFFADHYTISYVSDNVIKSQYTQVIFSRKIGGAVMRIGTVRINEIEDVI